MTDHTSAVERLPPLPEGICDPRRMTPVFTAADMHAYALAAIKQDSEAGADLDSLTIAISNRYPMAAVIRSLDKHMPGIKHAFAPPKVAEASEVTEAMVERAAKAMYVGAGGLKQDWEHDQHHAGILRNSARAALTAALRLETQGGGA